MSGRMKRRVLLAIVIAGAAVGGTAVVAGATGVGPVGDDDGRETPITGPALARASAAALAHTGGGRVTETEVGDEESYYEVEVRRPDGSQVDVQLDRTFGVVGAEADREDAGGDR